LALLELPRGLTPAELAGGFGFPGAAPPFGTIEESFRRRVQALPDQSRRLLMVAAADPTGDPGLVWRAAGLLGVGAEAAAPATAAGLVEFGAWVAFRHPLVRTAVYRSASPVQRQDVHRALAEVTDPRVDPDRRAWHRAQAAAGPDEDVAEELERSAGRAQARGGLAAAASFLERAALLTLGPVRRAQRLLAAARAKRAAGALEAALGLLLAVEAGPPDPLRAVEVEHLRGQVAAQQRRSSDGARLLLSAARRLERLDAAARAAPPAPGPPRVADILLDAFALRLTEGYAAAARPWPGPSNWFLRWTPPPISKPTAGSGWLGPAPARWPPRNCGTPNPGTPWPPAWPSSPARRARWCSCSSGLSSSPSPPAGRRAGHGGAADRRRSPDRRGDRQSAGGLHRDDARRLARPGGTGH
jgi:hypothetical protein